MKQTPQKKLEKLKKKRAELSKRREPNIRKRLRDIDTQIEVYQEQIKQMDSSNLQVSDHALLRYFERVKGFDLEQTKQEIITPELKTMVEQLGGNGRFPIGGSVVQVRDYVVVTVIVKGASI